MKNENYMSIKEASEFLNISKSTLFSVKLYGQRSHKIKQIVEQNKALFTKDGDHHESE